MGNTKPDITTSNTDDKGTGGTNSPSGTPSKTIKSSRWSNNRPVITTTFKGAIPELSSKVFVTGPSQATRYDDAYRALIHYFGNKFNHRVYRAFERKDISVGLSLLTKPRPPMVKKVIQEPTAGPDSKLQGVEKEVIDKDSEDFLEYQLELKQYVTDKAKYNDDIQICFNLIMGQCSPSVEQNLEADESFAQLKESSDSIGLMRLLETLCYNYRAHEYTPLGAWDAMDKLTSMRQPEEVHEVKRYESFKSVTEMCKASGINFAVMCSANIDMAIKSLNNTGKITATGTYDDGTYFRLSSDERKAVNKVAEEICLSTRFLSLASNKLHAASKQELRNDMVKGEDNYPRTIANTLRFLQYHNLRGKQLPSSDRRNKKATYLETAFAQQGDDEEQDEEDKPSPQQKSKLCSQWRDGTCAYKKKHTWKECPKNKFGTNFEKGVNSDGELILCTIAELSSVIDDAVDAALIDRVYGEEGDEVAELSNDNVKQVTFYCVDDLSTLVTTCHCNDEFVFMQNNFEKRVRTLFTQGKKNINPSWVLIDNQSTVDLFYNDKLLTNVRKVNDHIIVHCNAGKVRVNMMGELPGYGDVWYYPDGIANILSLFRVSLKFHVQYDSRVTGSFIVWKDDGSSREFKPGTNGLYYFDYSGTDETILLNDHDNDSVIRTVDSNLAKFTQRQVGEARVTRRFQNTAGLTTNSLLRMIDSGALLNSPITRESARAAVGIWGPSVANLKGKTTRSRPDPVNIGAATITLIPPHILEHHKEVTIGVDVMKVNNIPFMVSISRVIKFGTATELDSLKMPAYVRTITTILRIYASRGFVVRTIVADNGFAPLLQNNDFLTLGVNLNLTSEDEHEPHIERFIRTLKERCRMCFSLLPFSKVPRRLAIELVYCQTYWYNFTIPADYISDRLGLAAIMTGRTYDYNKICGEGTQFGEYVQTHESTDNTMRERTVGAITLRPSGNIQGAFYYYSLVTGRRLHRRKCTTLPMPQEVIDRVELIATRQKSPEGIEILRLDGTIFEDIPEAPGIEVEDDDLSYDESQQSEDDHENEGVDDPENNNNLQELEDSIGDETSLHNDDDVSLDSDSMVTAASHGADEIDIDGAEEVPNVQQAIIQDDTIINLDLDASNIIPDGDKRRRRPPRRDAVEGYELINNVEYCNAVTTYIDSLQSFAQAENLYQFATEHLILTQMGMSAGIKAFGQDGVNAIVKEMK